MFQAQQQPPPVIENTHEAQPWRMIFILAALFAMRERHYQISADILDVKRGVIMGETV